MQSGVEVQSTAIDYLKLCKNRQGLHWRLTTERGRHGNIDRRRYCATASGKYKTVAVKTFILGESDTHIDREVKLLEFDHKHIVQAIGQSVQKHIGTSMVLEFADYRSLQHLVRDPAISYSLWHVLTWVGQILSALEYLNTKGFFHRDIKPGNTLVFRRGLVVKLGDFGTAREFVGPEADSIVTAGQGSLQYRPPEAAITAHINTTAFSEAASCFGDWGPDNSVVSSSVGVGDSQVCGSGNDMTKRDVYSLGVTLHELVTRCTPRHIAMPCGRPEPRHETETSQLPLALRQIYYKCTAYHANDRPEVHKLATLIDAICRGLPNQEEYVRFAQDTQINWVISRPSDELRPAQAQSQPQAQSAVPQTPPRRTDRAERSPTEQELEDARSMVPSGCQPGHDANAAVLARYQALQTAYIRLQRLAATYYGHKVEHARRIVAAATQQHATTHALPLGGVESAAQHHVSDAQAHYEALLTHFGEAEGIAESDFAEFCTPQQQAAYVEAYRAALCHGLEPDFPRAQAAVATAVLQPPLAGSAAGGIDRIL